MNTPAERANQREIIRLNQTLFVFHAWQNLPVLGPDGVLFHLDTKALDVDNDNKGGGIPFIKRMRLIPITTTSRPLINNREGFAVSNMFVGSISNGQPAGIGSSMAGRATKTNVKTEWHYPDEKLSDMLYTFGKYGLVPINSVYASDAKSEARAQEIASVVMGGLDDRVLLEDIPEYFGEISPYLPEKKRARFSYLDKKILEAAKEEKVSLAEIHIELAAKNGVTVGDRTIKLNATEYTTALELLGEIKNSVLAAHAAAIDVGSGGILPETRRTLQTKEKRSYDALDMWLMKQFPSFPMDSEIEKANRQILNALEFNSDQSADPDAPEGYVSFEKYEELRKQNESFEERLRKIEQGGK